MQAVHSGDDLGSAIDAVMGYSHKSMKGKTVKVDPVPGIATPKTAAILDAALDAAKGPTGSASKIPVPASLEDVNRQHSPATSSATGKVPCSHICHFLRPQQIRTYLGQWNREHCCLSGAHHNLPIFCLFSL